MRSMPQALIWETIGRGWWLLLGFLAVSNLMPLMVYAEFSRYAKMNVSASEPAFLLMQVAFIPIVMIQLAIGILMAQGRVSRLYAFPISTSSIVAWHVGSGAILLALFISAISWMNNWLFDVGWPVANMALYAVALWAAIQLVISNSTSMSVPALFVTGLPTVLLVFWLPTRYGSYASQPNRYWSELTVGEFFFLAAIALGCWAFTNFTVGRARCGERFMSFGLLSWIDQQWDAWTRTASVQPPFRSPAAAQFWYEWRLKGHVLPLIFFSVLAIGFMVGVQSWIQNDYRLASAYEGLFTIACFVILLAVAAGFFLGMDTSSAPNGQRETQVGDAIDSEQLDVMGSFQASRPLETTTFARVQLQTAGLSMAVALSMWLVALGGLLSVMWLSDQLPATYMPVKDPPVYFASLLIGTWIAISNAAVAGQYAFRQAKLFWFAVTFFVVYLVGAVIMTNNLSTATQTLVHSVVIGGFSLATIALGAWAFQRALDRKYLSAIETSGLLVSAIAILVLLIAICPAGVPKVAYLVLAAFATLAVLPFALLPISLAANRNR